MSTLLDQLCERVGVLPGYHDIWGGFHQTPDATRRALLASMGLPAAIWPAKGRLIRAWGDSESWMARDMCDSRLIKPFFSRAFR